MERPTPTHDDGTEETLLYARNSARLAEMQHVACAPAGTGSPAGTQHLARTFGMGETQPRVRTPIAREETQPVARTLNAPWRHTLKNKQQTTQSPKPQKAGRRLSDTRHSFDKRDLPADDRSVRTDAWAEMVVKGPERYHGIRDEISEYGTDVGPTDTFARQRLAVQDGRTAFPNFNATPDAADLPPEPSVTGSRRIEDPGRFARREPL
eukprot:GHVU01133188.1.p1 GENE.GHVU01133188.1~~GHVU01133188.1.p1  ORF type:complete len:209 (+),score=16.26 GHVU01133188.1:2-628(+)